MPFLFLGVQVQAGGVDAGVASIALEELDVDKAIEQVSVILTKFW
jgi:hypothetical protein